MENFKKNSETIQNNTIENIQSEYNSLIRRYQNIFLSVINDIIHEQLRAFPCSIPTSKIEEWLEDYLISELKYQGRNKFNRLSDKLFENLEETLDETKRNTDSTIIKDNYQARLDEIIQKEREDWLYEIVVYFPNELAKRVTFYFEAFHGISDRNFEDNIYELITATKGQLLRKTELLADEYKNIMIDASNKNKKEMNKQFSSLRHINRINYERFNEIMAINNYELLESSGIKYAVNMSTGEKYEVELDGNILKLKGIPACFLVDDQKALYYNKNEEKTVCLKDLSLIVTNDKGENGYSISQGFSDYTFSQNNKPCNNPDEILSIINRLKEDVPNGYYILSQDTYFQKIINSNSKGNQLSEEIPKVEEISGITPKKR